MAQSYKEWQKSIRRYSTSPDYPDMAVRWKPDAIDVPEKLKYVATTLIPGLSGLTFLQRSLPGLDIENQAQLTEINFPFLESISAHLICKTNTHLADLSAPNIGLPLYGTSLSGASIDFSGNALTAASVDALFNRLALSLSGGAHAYYTKIDTSGGTSAAPTAASSLARSSLYLGAAARNITIAVN